MNKEQQTVYHVWSEYDVGLGEVVFYTEDEAREAAMKAWANIDDTGETFEELEEAGLFGVDSWSLVHE